MTHQLIGFDLQLLEIGQSLFRGEGRGGGIADLWPS
jgi:hypothetical protein